MTIVRLSTSARIVSCDNFSVLRDELLDMHCRTGAKKVVLNLDNIEYLHSLAIGFLLKVYQVSIQEGGWLRICHVQSEVKEALVVTQASATQDAHGGASVSCQRQPYSFHLKSPALSNSRITSTTSLRA